MFEYNIFLVSQNELSVNLHQKQWICAMLVEKYPKVFQTHEQALKYAPVLRQILSHRFDMNRP